uniref:autotransporter outer membrane beta-barrel domain-containing protein n=1 Tax=Halomonas sp. TaxID=1486246 RepID=UPI002637F086|nr:autotransporter outer membrane beta-barrel domain-containing protein [Halomonas sp.]
MVKGISVAVGTGALVASGLAQAEIGLSAGDLVQAIQSPYETEFSIDGSQAHLAFYSAARARPVSFSWDGEVLDLLTSNSFVTMINGRQMTIVLPEAGSLLELGTNAPVTIIDEDGNVIVNNRSLNTLTYDESAALAGELGLLDVDRLLRSAQVQAMGQVFSPVTNQIDLAMYPSYRGNYSRKNGVNIWTSVQGGNIEGNAVSSDYDGDSKSAILGVDYKHDNLLVGIAAGNQELDLESDYDGRFDFGGELVAPYGAVSFFDDALVFDAVLLYQNIEGSQRNSYLLEPIDLDGERWGGQASGTLYLPQYKSFRAGLTVGGSYLNDEVDGRYLDSKTDDFGLEIGEAFGGLKFGWDLDDGRVYGNLIYHRDISDKFDDDIDYLDNGDEDGWTVLEIGAAHQLGRNMDFNIGGRTTLGSDDVEYRSLYASLNYRF